MFITRLSKIGVIFLVATNSTHAQITCPELNVPVDEPAFCDNLNEIDVPARLKKKTGNTLHVFELGSVKLAGFAVGRTPIEHSKVIAGAFSNTTKGEKFCTWYINDNNQNAAQAFRYHYVPNPRDLPLQESINEYLRVLGPQFLDTDNGFLECARDRGYIGLGCHGMSHRGPTAFAMLLSFAGCHPQRTTALANALWKLNGIKENVRLSIVEEGYKLGRCNLNVSAEFAKLFSTRPSNLKR